MKVDDPHIGEVVAALAESQSELYGYIFLRLGNDADARDVLQETNLYLWKNLANLDSPDNFLPWAKALAGFQIRRFLTDRKRDAAKVVFDSETSERLGELLAEPASDEGPAYEEVDYEALKSCLGKLTPEKRALVYRRYWDDRTVEAIAREENAPFSTVAMRFLRIRKELGDCVRRLICRPHDGSKPGRDELTKAELFERVLDGDPASGCELCRRFQSDPALCREWLETGAIHAALRFDAKKLNLTAGTPRRSRFWPRALAAGLAFLLLGGFAYAYRALSRTGAAAPVPVPAAPAVVVPSTSVAPVAAAPVVTAAVARVQAAQTLPEAVPAAEVQGKETQLMNVTNSVRAAVAAAAVAVAGTVQPLSAGASYADQDGLNLDTRDGGSGLAEGLSLEARDCSSDIKWNLNLLTTKLQGGAVILI